MADTYYTISSESEGLYKEKMSKFISFAIPVSTVSDAKAEVARITNKYHDARHVCWAYMVGPERKDFLSSDNGEPSGTAGKPILGQINSFNLTNLVIAVVRYFGGIKLGTSGLISAYREAARSALENAEIIECHRKIVTSFSFPYLAMNQVMKLAKLKQVRIREQRFDNTCMMQIETNADDTPPIIQQLNNIDGVSML